MTATITREGADVIRHDGGPPNPGMRMGKVVSREGVGVKKPSEQVG